MSSESLPAFLQSTFQLDRFCTINITYLRVGVKQLVSGKIRYVSVDETPHYMFVRYILQGTQPTAAQGYRDYTHYISVHPHSCTEEAYRELIASIKDNGYDSENQPILVFRWWRRPWPPGRWDVADGFHRLAVLAALGEQSITVRKLRPRKNIVRRAIGRALRVCLHADTEQEPRRIISS